MLKYWAFKIAGLIMSLMPMRVGYAIANFLGDITYLLAKKSRNVVGDNMRHVLGEGVSLERLRQVVRGVFRNTGKNYFDLIRLPRLDLQHLEQILSVHGWHYLEEAFNEGRGVILATAHLGNVDLAAQTMAARSIKVTILTEPLQPARMLQLVTAWRESWGIACLPVGLASLKTAIRSLRQGGTVLMACDRNIQGKGMRTKFFGEEATLPTGVVDLALRTGAVVIPVFSVRQANNRFAIYGEPPLRMSVITSRDDALRRNVEKVTAIIEKYIRRHPEQWTVFHPVWADGN